MSTRKALGPAIRAIRTSQKMTQFTLSEAANIHFAYLSNIESGKKQPSEDVILSLAKKLGVHPDAISYVVEAQDAA